MGVAKNHRQQQQRQIEERQQRHHCWLGQQGTRSSPVAHLDVIFGLDEDGPEASEDWQAHTHAHARTRTHKETGRHGRWAPDKWVRSKAEKVVHGRRSAGHTAMQLRGTATQCMSNMGGGGVAAVRGANPLSLNLEKGERGRGGSGERGMGETGGE